MFVYSRAAPAHFYARPKPNLTRNLILTQTFPRVLHGQSHYLGRPPLFRRKCKLLHMLKHNAVSLDFGIMSTAAVPVDSPFKLSPVNDSFNSLPNDKIMDWTDSKAFADDISNMAEMMISAEDTM